MPTINVYIDGFNVIKTEEKGSDVNLACHLVVDAYEKNSDAAFVVSNDSDLVEPIRIARAKLGMTVGFAPPVLLEGSGARRPPWGAIGVFLILVALHLAFRPGPRLLFGWLPAELAWRIAYCILAWAFLVWISLRVWREEPDP